MVSRQFLLLIPSIFSTNGLGLYVLYIGSTRVTPTRGNQTPESDGYKLHE